MDRRIKEIYKVLYTGSKSKSYLAIHFNVTTKTVENTIAKIADDVVYDKKLSAYRFAKLLPKYIPSNVFLMWIQNSINNEVIKHDFLSFSKFFEHKQDECFNLLPTASLSSMVKKIIQLHIAIVYNASLKMEYRGHNNVVETKYIKPHKINTTLNSYYIYASYDTMNKKDSGEFRSFSLGGILSLESVSYSKEEHYAIEGIGNAYGMISKEQYVTLKLTGKGASYFKREGEFSRAQFDYICEEADGSILMKMYYNNTQEIVQLIQRWIPYIEIHDEGDVKEAAYSEIDRNYLLWKNKEELC
jgi:hypothetical protein